MTSDSFFLGRPFRTLVAVVEGEYIFLFLSVHPFFH